MLGKRELSGINRAWRAAWCACGGATQRTSMKTFCNWLCTPDGRNIQIWAVMKLFWQPGCCFQINSKQRSLRHQKRAPPTYWLSPTRPTCFAAENTIERKCSSEGGRWKKLPFKGERGGKNMGTGRKAEGTLLLLWCWYHLFSPQLSKEALKQTYTDSSKGLKGGHRKVMCLCYC